MKKCEEKTEMKAIISSMATVRKDPKSVAESKRPSISVIR